MVDCSCFIILTWKHQNFLEISLMFFRVFHDLSIQLLNECYGGNGYTTHHLISRHMKDWNKESCFRIMNLLDLNINPENSQLITHPSFQDLLSSFWNGDLDIENPHVKSNNSSPWLVSAFSFLMYISEKVNLFLTYFLRKILF